MFHLELTYIVYNIPSCRGTPNHIPIGNRNIKLTDVSLSSFMLPHSRPVLHVSEGCVSGVLGDLNGAHVG